MPTQDPAGTDDRRDEAPERTILPAAGPSGAPPVAIDQKPGSSGPAEPDPAEAEFERLTGHPIDARPTQPPAGDAERSETDRPG
jgi:hypothetical protein